MSSCKASYGQMIRSSVCCTVRDYFAVTDTWYALCYAPASDLAATIHKPLLELPAPHSTASDVRPDLWQSTAEDHFGNVQQLESVFEQYQD